MAKKRKNEGKATKIQGAVGGIRMKESAFSSSARKTRLFVDGKLPTQDDGAPVNHHAAATEQLQPVRPQANDPPAPGLLPQADAAAAPPVGAAGMPPAEQVAEVPSCRWCVIL